jgi:hypothetical protein
VVCGKPVEEIQALAQRKRENRDTARVCFRVGTRGEACVLRHPRGVRILLARSADERLVLVQVRRAFLEMHCLPFGWGRSAMCVTQLMVPMIGKLRQQYRVLAYLDDFLICLVKARTIASTRYCRKATQVIDKLLSSSALTLHQTKVNWSGVPGWNTLMRDILWSHEFPYSAAKIDQGNCIA